MLPFQMKLDRYKRDRMCWKKNKYKCRKSGFHDFIWRIRDPIWYNEFYEIYK